MTIPCGQPWEFGTPSAYDNCCTNVRVFVLGTVTNGLCPQYITRTWAALDCCNNSNTCSQTVAIVNTTPPVINCSTNKNVECGTNWTFDTPTAYSPCCPNVVVTVVGTYTNAQGPCYAYYTRVWQAVDCCNNTNTCSQTVFVTDTKPPV